MKCFSKVSIPRPNGRGSTDRVTIPCGKCPSCLSQKRTEWAFRLEQELKVAKSASFITLTYEDSSKKELSKSDVQLFLKRLRRSNNKIVPTVNFFFIDNLGKCYKPSVRYFMVGEYGSKTFRPHYHAIIFNLNPEMLQDLEKTWGLGFVYKGDVNSKTIAYTLKYMLKQSPEISGCEKPFAIMSRRPGLGENYIGKTEKWHKSNKVFYSLGEGGIKKKLPRYYKDKIFSPEERKINNLLSIKKVDLMEKHEHERIRKLGNNPFTYQFNQKVSLARKIIKQNKKDKI